MNELHVRLNILRLTLNNEIFNPEGDILILENLLKDDPSKAKNSEIDSLIKGPSDTFLMGDEDIKLNPPMYVDNLVPIPKVSEKPLDSLDPILETFKMTITDPLFDFIYEFTLNSDNPMLDIQYMESDESEMKTIMDEVQSNSTQSTAQIPPLYGKIPYDHEDPCLFSILQSPGLQSSAYFGILNPDHMIKDQKSIHHLSGSPTPFSDPVVASLTPSLTPTGDSDSILEETDTLLPHHDLTSPKVDDDIFDPEGDIRLLERLLNLDSTKDLPPPHELNNEIFNPEEDILILENLLKEDPSEA
ncbi:hypothetical protein Tco_0774119 [Tanacetum coccineum]|uniref:Reverse transcriptase domain-containing protein n=1 Tax=Tanacetum coccineum TaxID=301880 RepID=A0ABQ4ZMM5_9ASTR